MPEKAEEDGVESNQFEELLTIPAYHPPPYINLNSNIHITDMTYIKLKNYIDLVSISISTGYVYCKAKSSLK